MVIILINKLWFFVGFVISFVYSHNKDNVNRNI